MITCMCWRLMSTGNKVSKLRTCVERLRLWRVRAAAKKECREAAEWSRKHPHVEEEAEAGASVGHSLRKVNTCKYLPIGSIIILPDDVYKSSKIMLPKEGLCL